MSYFAFNITLAEILTGQHFTVSSVFWFMPLNNEQQQGQRVSHEPLRTANEMLANDLPQVMYKNVQQNKSRESQQILRQKKIIHLMKATKDNWNYNQCFTDFYLLGILLIALIGLKTRTVLIADRLRFSVLTAYSTALFQIKRNQFYFYLFAKAYPM